jgi:NAD(P)-dependent dehydrogenase (short-subunit alcohol dehydrogenase family)
LFKSKYIIIFFLFIFSAAAFTLGYIEDVSADDWSHILNVNVRGYALMVKHIAPILKKQNNGSILNISSAAGLVAHSNFLPYSTSKGAINQMTRNLALDLGSFNIRVNSISPGAIDSPTIYRTADEGGLTKEQFDKDHAGKCIQRLGQAQEIANFIVFLASDLCKFITGTNIVIDGGYTTV